MDPASLQWLRTTVRTANPVSCGKRLLKTELSRGEFPKVQGKLGSIVEIDRGLFGVPIHGILRWATRTWIGSVSADTITTVEYEVTGEQFRALEQIGWKSELAQG